MLEDDTYRTSSQYRLWSYTRSRLADQRRQTSQLAADKVRTQFRRSRQNGTSNGHNGQQSDAAAPVDPSVNIAEIEQAILTPDDEVKLVNWGVRKVQDIAEVLGTSGKRIRVPSNVTATACQLLRRFYLSVSPMTYHPRPLLVTFLFLASKCEHFYIKISDIVHALKPEVDPSISEESIKASEFLILQGLRFTLDVRHPMRGLNGGLSDIKALVKEGKLEIDGGEKRLTDAANEVKSLLIKECQGCDVYFLYTPSQIWLAGLWTVDKDLCTSYLQAKLSELGDKVPDKFKIKLVETIKECADEIKEYEDPDDKAFRKALARINKKLTVCADPDKVDIVAVMKAKKAEKREGTDSEREEKIKKRKLERERLQRDGEVFGGSLKDVQK